MEISSIENSNLHIQIKKLNICTTQSKTHGKSRDFSIARIYLFRVSMECIETHRLVERPYRSTVSGVAKRDEGNKTMKTVAHSKKNEQPHTYHSNEAGTRPRTTIAHPHRSTRPRWAHHAVHGKCWQFASFRFDEIELKLYHFRSISLWMFDFLYQPNMLTHLPPWGIPRVNHV